MRRLDEIVAGLLPGLRAMVVEEERAGDREGPRQAARDGRGDKAPALAKSARQKPALAKRVSHSAAVRTRP